MNTALRGTATAELARLRHHGAGSPPATEGTGGRRCSRGRSRGSIIEGQRPLRWPVRVFLGGPKWTVDRTVGLHVPNCELFAGRSRYRERASRPRLSPYEPPAHRVGGSSTLSRAVPSLQQRTAKTPPIFDAVPLQRQDRTWLFRQSIGQAPPGQQTPPRSVERDGCGRRRGLSFTSALALTPPDFCFG